MADDSSRSSSDEASSKHRLLTSSEKDTNWRCSHCAHCDHRHRRIWSPAIISVAGLVFCALTANAIVWLWLFRTAGQRADPSLRLFSPANDAVDYVERVFDRSRGDSKSPFQGWPTDEIDRRWDEAFLDGMLTTVDKQTADKLPEKTERLPVPGREDEYLVTLDVFHQMHCLNVVRMALYRDRYSFHFYNDNGTVDYCKWLHVDHCLDQVRQALMCQADVSVVYYAWSDIVEGLRPRVDNVHTCRDYDKLLGWARERSIPAELWHSSKHVVEDEEGRVKIEKGRNHALNGGGECNAV